MKKIAMLLMLVFSAGTVFSPVVMPVAQAAWYPCPVTGCVGHSSYAAVYDHYGRRDGLTAVRRDVLDMLEKNSDLGREYNWRARVRQGGGGIPVFGYPGGGYGGAGGVVATQDGGQAVSPVEIGVAGTILGGTFGGLKGAAIGGVGGYLGTKAVKAAINKHRQGDGSGGHRPYFGQGRDGQFELTNATTAPLDVFDGRKFVGHMQAGEVRQVLPPKDRYRAEALVPNSRGGISKGGLETVATENGWIFIKPASARAGR